MRAHLASVTCLSAVLGCNSITGAGDLILGGGGAGGSATTTSGSGAQAMSSATGAGATATTTGTTGGASTSTTTTATSSTSTGVSNDAYQLCVDTINMYRATLGLPPYARWSAEESCADGQCQSDSQTGTAHGAFGQCGEFAQNECPGWPGPPESMITQCLAAMWAEGPGSDFQTHGHYINMSSTQYSQVACGFYTTPSGSVWAVQDFQ